MSKNLYLFVFVGVAAMICLAATAANSEYVCGDANDDGTLNVSDAVFIINHVFIGGPAPDPNCCSDCPPTMTDYDGNVYQTVQIGDQCWMMENLKVTHYRNGDPVPDVTVDADWEALITGAYCEYNNDGGYVEVYGRLYNFYAIEDSRNLAPEGWHVPTDAEWLALINYLGGESVAGGKMKEAGTEHWAPPNDGATNESGFTALPAGARNSVGTFYNLGSSTTFWTADENKSNVAWFWVIYYSNPDIYSNYCYKAAGFSIRCLKD
ncbi:MAG TPA: hypothetical protein ENO22_02600 [candidate division Zixibacteria bacterium]|nr:hypothetical protein [candidate division Zixibacteria bacterium]